MKRRLVLLLACFAFNVSASPFSRFGLTSLFSEPVEAVQDSQLGELGIAVPEGWELRQSTLAGGVAIKAYLGPSAYTILYARSGRESLMSRFTDVAVAKQGFESIGSFRWEQITAKRTELLSGHATPYVAAFQVDFNGKTYQGFTQGADQATAEAGASAFMNAMRPTQRSLTGSDYTGKKFYVGWGAASNWDPSSMHNEVKYDVLHTHDLFTKELGGLYASNKLIGYKEATASKIRSIWKSVKEKFSPGDMYVQYSSGHGSESGLGVGVSYDEIRDNALSYPAKEVIVFIMACYSGNLVDSFNKRKSEWQNWQSLGKSLMVMASSKASETSSTGPGTDSDQSGGVNGSAGSAFGHSLWKALIGYADGALDGVKDGFISLGEVEKYATKRTIELGEHTPVVTGSYHPGLILNQVPPKAYLEVLSSSTESLSDVEIQSQIQELNQALSVN